MRKKKALLMILASFFLLIKISVATKAAITEEEDEGFIKKETEWRVDRDRQMRSPQSWLTIAGLFWLKEGENSFGIAPSNKIVLPPDSAPSQAGIFILREGKIKVMANEGIELRSEGKAIKVKILETDDSGSSAEVELADLQMWVIKRGGRYAIRLRDLNAPAYKNYRGLEFFPPQKNFKIEADFVPYSPPKTIPVPTIIGTEEEMTSPGYVKFVFKGQEYHLDAFRADEKNTKLFFIFGDETNGKDTYGGGRFMVSDVLENGKVDLNFNRAKNPPCAYTPYATCPLPPPQNILKVQISAGEKTYPDVHH